MSRNANYIRILLLWPALLLALGMSGHTARTQGEESHAGLVLRFADGSVRTYCLAFAGESISGLDLLLKTGLEVKVEAYGGMGVLVCKIGRDGCDFPEQPCVCQSYGQGGVYWSYHHLKDGKWKSAVTGAGSHKVRDGDVEGWAWSDGKPPSPIYTFEQLCGQPLPTPINLEQPTALTESATQAITQPQNTPTTLTKPTSTVPQRATATKQLAPTHTPQPEPANTNSAPKNTPPTAPTYTRPSTPIPHPPSPIPYSPTPNLQPPSPNTDPSAGRNISIVVGLVSALGFVLWRVLSSTRLAWKLDETEDNDVG